MVGGQYGQGALIEGDRTLGYFNIAGASFGFTIGAQVSGLAMFFMTDAARAALDAANGWEIGAGPSVVAFDAGLQASVTSTTLTEDVYTVSFSQQGLMASLAINGSKITRINPS
jgi:lipid-binding SYLF domain-containing protein